MPADSQSLSWLPNEGKRAIHFGAGNIGRGFIGPLLSSSGYIVCFADVDEQIINKLNAAKHYSVEILHRTPRTEIIRRVEGLHSNDPKLVDLLAHTDHQDGAVDIITTSVGPAVLPRLAGSIAAGLERRMVAGGPTLNVIACENMVGATQQLAKAVYSQLEGKDDVIAWVDQNVGWANCAVDRIVPVFQTPPAASELDVGVEPFFEWAVDRNRLKGDVDIKGMKIVDNLEAYVERKLYTLNAGHASLAYLGSLKGYTMIDHALKDDEIRDIVQVALEESGSALVKKHGFSPQEHGEYVVTIMERFSNPLLRDEVKRVGRQPRRKLSPHDRLVGPTNMLRSFSLPRRNLLTAIAAALHFHHEEDEDSVQLQEKIASHGVDVVLQEISGWSLSNEGEAEDIRAVVQHYEALATWKDGSTAETHRKPATPRTPALRAHL